MGGMLILAATITKGLFSLNKIARKIALTNWKPQIGIMPMNIPKPTEAAFN